ncbi:hypothetical protein ABT160_33265 [Streptomyces sp. NPDC001941]|uniref:hypothetical protein n=1 Tax=Streptomyces sp. NPDC001941 TaxID=3154659 RepID=UPI00332FB137
MTASDEGQWYYNVKTRSVEQGTQSSQADRMGPYATREEAERAIETAEKRNEDWNEDPRWNDDK